MARRPRLFVSDIPYHIVQRGNNRNSIFSSDEDYAYFLEVLQEAKIKHRCLIYSYCLMTNHFHLLAKPEEKGNISWLMKLLGAKYVRYFNKAYKRTGTLWEGRFKSSLIDEELYFLACLHYIEMNPVRAGIVSSPELYRWSSYRIRAFGEKSPVVDLDPWYNSLADNETECQLRYRKFFQNLVPESTCKLIREMTRKDGIVGGDGFKKLIEKLTHKEIIFRSPGRPKRDEK
ncbi:MAG: transposase [Candidatus Omnitrophota bacterium]|nr:transposase [Candidatus Omnitrophota bacterium]